MEGTMTTIEVGPEQSPCTFTLLHLVDKKGELVLESMSGFLSDIEPDDMLIMRDAVRTFVVERVTDAMVDEGCVSLYENQAAATACAQATLPGATVVRFVIAREAAT